MCFLFKRALIQLRSITPTLMSFITLCLFFITLIQAVTVMHHWKKYHDFDNLITQILRITQLDKNLQYIIHQATSS